MNTRKYLMSLGAALATSKIARQLQALDSDDILGTIGLERRRSHVWESVAVFSLGAIAGAGAALLLAPASGRETRAKLGTELDRLATEVKNEGPAMLSRVTSGVNANSEYSREHS